MGILDFFFGTEKDDYYEECRRRAEEDKELFEVNLRPVQQQPVNYSNKPKGVSIPANEVQRDTVPLYRGEPLDETKIAAEPVKKSVLTPVYKEKKDVIIFVVENTFMVNEYKNEILRLINKIVEDNKECFFLFLRTGNHKQYFEVSDYQSIMKDNLLENLLISAEEDCAVDYLDVLKHIDSFLSTCIMGIFEYNHKKYDIQNNSIIFMGTGDCHHEEYSKKESMRLIKRINSRIKVKTIKYFCMEDSQTLKAATLGFPVIGHIVTDFYK